MRQRTTIAGAVAAALLLMACGEADPADVEVSDVDDAPDPADADAENEVEGGSDESADTAEPSATPEESGDATDTDAPAASGDVPAPDPERVDDPCAEHEGRNADVFIDLVAPVDDQVATDEVEIVGCSNVYEATVAWTLLDGDGRTLAEGVTTAECGSGCVGAFRQDVPLDIAEDEPVAYLQVFSPNVSDEGPPQQELTEVVVVLG